MKKNYFILFKIMDLVYDINKIDEGDIMNYNLKNSVSNRYERQPKDLKILGSRVSDTDNNKVIDESDRLFLRYILESYKALTGETIDLNRFQNAHEAIEMMKRAEERDYIVALLRPERARGCKIPAQMPIPSSSFQLKNSMYISTNLLGNASLAINPYYLTDGANSTVFLNNNAALTGLGITNNMFLAVSGGQTIPQGIYHQYRLVSASVIVKYIGRLDIVQGIIGGAIVYDKGVVPTAIGSPLAILDKYSDFNLSRDAFFQQEYYAIQGMRELYFPLDNSFEEYQSLNNSKDGFMFFVYIQNAPPGAASFKVDFCFNFECLPDVRFLNYIPTDVAKPSSPIVKEQAYEAVKKAPIQKESELQEVKKGDFWGGLKEKLGSMIPGAMELVGKGVLAALV